ncbi:MAG: aminotransferase class I/II-fold pyridoxal phosphate-dependent enzyme [Chloroflexi bacterium]|nr:aminotransferase class I/II-fold pyridoxal phosphate-dependent enzyme [Chloroflexota bacterium]
MKELRRKGFVTRAVHAGERALQGDYTPVATPIHPTVGFVYESMDDLDAIFATTREGYVYPRYGSPTVAAFEQAIAELEAGEAAHAYASGMAAVHAALLAAGVRAGTTVVGAMDVYGATFTLLQRLFSQLGATARWVDVTDLASVEAALAETRPVALWAETISNPLLKVADIPALADLAHRYGAQCLIDNTFGSPYLCNPIAHGADYVVHSATKYIGGHGDVMAGVVVTANKNKSTLYELNKLVGGVLGPFEAWLALRGVKTLPLRMRQQCANAARIAEWLTQHPKVAWINYPGLSNHAQHALAQKLFGARGFGGMVSFEIVGADRAKAFRFMEALELCLPATTLGDIYTLVLHPASSSHRGLTPAERAQVGIGEGLVRMSVGIEDADDIIADLAQALDNAGM